MGRDSNLSYIQKPICRVAVKLLILLTVIAIDILFARYKQEVAEVASELGMSEEPDVKQLLEPEKKSG